MRYFSKYGHYELNPFPGCNNLVVSNHSFVRSEKRGHGWGQAAHLDRLHNASKLGYGAIICTVRADNEVEKYLLYKNGWMQIFEFTNSETGLPLQIWARHLEKAIEREEYDDPSTYIGPEPGKVPC